MEDCGRSRRSQLPATFPLIVLLFREDFFTGESISDGISRERKYPPVSRLFPPSLDEIGFRWPPNVFRYSFLIGSTFLPLLLSRYIFSKTSLVISPFFLFFFKRPRFRAKEEVAGAPPLFYRSSSPPPLPSLSLSLVISLIVSTRLYSGFPEARGE